MRRWILALVFLPLVGCASFREHLNNCIPNRPTASAPPVDPKAQFQMTMDGLVGKSADALVTSFGYPTRAFQSPTGNVVYAYERSSSSVVTWNAPALTTGYGYGNTATATNWGGNSYSVPVTKACNVYFEVDSSTHVVRWLAQGNACY